MFLRNVKRQFVYLVKDFNATIDQIIMKGSWMKKRFGISYAMKKSNSHGMLKKQVNSYPSKREAARTHTASTTYRKNLSDRNVCKVVGKAIQDKSTRLK